MLLFDDQNDVCTRREPWCMHADLEHTSFRLFTFCLPRILPAAHRKTTHNNPFDHKNSHIVPRYALCVLVLNSLPRGPPHPAVVKAPPSRQSSPQRVSNGALNFRSQTTSWLHFSVGSRLSSFVSIVVVKTQPPGSAYWWSPSGNQGTIEWFSEV